MPVKDLSLNDEQLEIFEANEKLAYKVAHRVMSEISKNSIYTFDDILQMALVTLCLAIKGYDPNRNIKFSTYAYVSMYKTLIRDMIRENKKTSAVICYIEEVHEDFFDKDLFNDNFEFQNIIEKELSKVSASQKRSIEMFLLRTLKNMSGAEIAKKYNVSEKEVYVYAERGKKLLAQSEDIRQFGGVA